MEWKTWLDDYLIKKMDEVGTKLRKIIYNLNGGEDRSFEGPKGERIDFYGCNKCKSRYVGIGTHFIVARKDLNNKTKDLIGTETLEEGIDLLNETNMCGNTDRIVLCKYCYIEYLKRRNK